MPCSRSARSAPSSTTSAPREALAYRSHSLKLDWRALLRMEARPDGLARDARAECARAASRCRSRPGSPRPSPSRPRAPCCACRPTQVRARHADLVAAQLLQVARPRRPAAASGSARGRPCRAPSTSESTTSRSAGSRIATWAARMSLSPKLISSVAVVSFSFITGTTPHSSSLREGAARVQVLHRAPRCRRTSAAPAPRARRAREQLRVDVVQRALADRGRRLQLLHRRRAARACPSGASRARSPPR